MKHTFSVSIRYLKIVTLFTLIFSAVSVVTQSFDPWRSLEQLLVHDLYGTETLPPAAAPMYHFVFMLFAWISVPTSLMQYAVIHYALAKKERWAYWVLLVSWLLWIVGAAGIALATGAYSYFYSVGAVTILFISPLLLLWKHIFLVEKNAIT